MRVRAAAMALVAALVALVDVRAAGAAEVTELWSPFPQGGETVGVKVGLGWRHRATRLSVDRELLCLAHETIGGQSACAGGSGVVMARDLEAEVIESALDVDFRIALFRAIEARVRLPIVLHGSTSLTFADGVDGRSSRTAPYNADAIFALPNDSGGRGGLGDPVLGIWGAPLSSAREENDPTLLLGLELTLPIAEPRRAGSTNVGGGIFGVTLAVAGSARVYDWLEPFARLDVALQLGADNTLYPDLGETQTVSGPPHRIGLRAGLELVPWEQAADGSAVRIELGGHVELVTAGRSPTVLFDAIGTSACSPSDADDPCTLTTTASGRPARGATIEEEHLALGTWLGVHYDVFETLRLTVRANVGWRTPHFLTFSDIGADTDGDGLVEGENARGQSEYDPDYVPTWDDPGGRFRSSSELTLGIDVGVSARW